MDLYKSGRSKKKSDGRRKPDSSSRSFRNSGDRPAYAKIEARCADCSIVFEPPFTPRQGRPVYCSRCFRNHRDDDGRSSSDRRQGYDRSSDRPRYGDNRSSSDRRQGYDRSSDRPRYGDNRSSSDRRQGYDRSSDRPRYGDNRSSSDRRQGYDRSSDRPRYGDNRSSSDRRQGYDRSSDRPRYGDNRSSSDRRQGYDRSSDRPRYGDNRSSSDRRQGYDRSSDRPRYGDNRSSSDRRQGYKDDRSSDRRQIRYENNDSQQPRQEQKPETDLHAGFYDSLREKLFAILGGSVCSGCGYKDERALGFSHVHGDISFDKIRRGGTASAWEKYISDPDTAQKELKVLCLNCNEIRQPIARSKDSKPEPKKKTDRFPR